MPVLALQSNYMQLARRCILLYQCFVCAQVHGMAVEAYSTTERSYSMCMLPILLPQQQMVVLRVHRSPDAHTPQYRQRAH
jgi:hypothetical protein